METPSPSRPRALLAVRRACLAAAVAVTALGAFAGSARADADPASDVLLYEDVFVPYSDAVSEELDEDLSAVLKEARARRKPMKVALIAAPQDLGGVGGLFGKPQEYARFLGQELGIGSRNDDTLLTVMPAGLGVYRGEGKTISRERTLLRGIESGEDADDLARAAVTAVERLAGVDSGSSGSSARTALVVTVAGLVVLSLLAVGGLLAVRRRRPSESPGT